MTVFDTNAILRYILHDNEEMADKVEKEILNGECFIPMEVFAEMVFVLSKVYKAKRADIAENLKEIAHIRNISTTDRDALESGLDVFGTTKLDFIDCLLVAYHKQMGYQISTFDKELTKYIK